MTHSGHGSQHYEDFYWVNENGEGKLVALRTLLDAFPHYAQHDKNEMDEYTQHYKDKMYCPDCHRARLKLTCRGSHRYLAAISADEHSPDCWRARSAMADPQNVRMYVADMSDAEREGMLNSAIKRLMKRDSGESKSRAYSAPLDSSRVRPTTIATVDTALSMSKRPLVRSVHTLVSLRTDAYYVVSGKICIWVNHLSNKRYGDFYNICLNDKKNKHLLDIKCSPKVFEHIHTDDSNTVLPLGESGPYYFAGYCDIQVRQSGSHIYRNCSIKHSSKIVLVACK